MKKFQFLLYVLVFLYSFFGQLWATELEDLWQDAELYSEEIFSAKQNRDYYQTSRETLRVLYPLSFTLSASPTFYKNYEQYSDELEIGSASAVLTQTLPGGAKVSAGAVYGISTGYRTWNSTDGYSDKGYSDNVSVQFQYSQSLNPYWLHGSFSDPSKTKLSLNLEGGEYNLIQAKKNIFSKVLSLYIQFRKIERNLMIAEKEIVMLKINLDAIKKMKISESVLLSDVWQQEKSLASAQASYNSAILERQEIIKSISELCGTNYHISEKADFPENFVCISEIDPFLNNLQIQLQLLKSQYLLDRQNSAAQISFLGQIKETSHLKDEIGIDFKDDTNYFSWSATISGKINNLYGGDGKLYKKKYETERAKLEKQIRDYKTKIEDEKLYYDNLILSYNENLKNAIFNEKNEKEKFAGVRKLYENGQKTQIDFLVAEINYLKQKYYLENVRDSLWQTKWLRVQFPDMSYGGE